MIQFYETYRDNIIVSPLVTQLSWTNNLLILQGTKTIDEFEIVEELKNGKRIRFKEIISIIQNHRQSA